MWAAVKYFHCLHELESVVFSNNEEIGTSFIQFEEHIPKWTTVLSMARPVMNFHEECVVKVKTNEWRNENEFHNFLIKNAERLSDVMSDGFSRLMCISRCAWMISYNLMLIIILRIQIRNEKKNACNFIYARNFRFFNATPAL